MNLEVKIEIRSIVKKITSQLTDSNTHNFTVFVQGLNGNQIEHFVKRVVFYLPFNSSNSQQVKTKPPYLISGSTHACFRLPIDIFLHASEGCNKVRYSYYVYLPDKLVENAVNVKTLTFLNTPQDFRERLLLGGAEVVKQSNSEAVAIHVKSEPVEIIENQNESLGNDANAEFKVSANKKAADTENTSKKNVENLECKTEPTEGADIQNEIHNELPSTCVQSKDISEQNGSLVIQDVYSLDELMKENEILKKENETLYNKFSKQEGVIATYVEKLPVLQNNFSAVRTELGQLQQKAEANETEITSLKSTVQTLISEILQQRNKVDEVKEQKKRPIKPAVASSSVSESFPGMTSISLQNEPYTNNSHKVQTKEKGMVMNECTISHTSFEFPTLSADSNIMQDACKNPLKSSCNTSENKAASSSFSYLNDNVSAYETVQKASAPETFLNSSYNKTVTENSHNFSIQNKPSSCSNNLNGTWSIYESPWHRISSIYPSGQDSSLKAEDKEHAIRNSERTNVVIHNIRKLSTHCDSLGRQADKDIIEEVTLQESLPTINKLFNLNPEEMDVVLPDSTTGQDYFYKEVCKNVLEEPDEQYVEGDLQIIEDEEHGDLQIIEDEEHGDFQIIEDEEHRNSSHKEKDPVPNVLKTGLYQNVTKETANCRKDEIKLFSPNKEDTELAVLSCSKRGPVKVIQISTKEDCLKEKLHENVCQEVTQKQIKSKLHEFLSKRKNMKFTNLSHKEGNTMSSNYESISIENNSLQKESTKYLSKKGIQECVKGGLQVNLNQQKRDPVVSNFIHLKNPSLNMKRTIFLPIPEDRKRHCRAKKNLHSVKQKIMCSVPSAALLNNSDSVKQSAIDEQVSLPVKNSLDTITFGDKTSSPIPVQIKNTAPENCSALNSVDRNSCFTAKANRSQSVADRIRASPYCQRGLRNEGFKKRSNCSALNSVDKNLCKGQHIPAKVNKNQSIADRIRASPYCQIGLRNGGFKKRSNCSALNSVDKNLCKGQHIPAKANKNQSIADRIRASPYCQIGLRNDFKKCKSETKSSNPIGSIFKDIDDRLISEAKQNYYVHLLTEFLTNPKNCPNISVLIFLVIEHLRNTTKNYLQAFSEDRANCIFLSSSESCIVSTLFEIEKKRKIYSQLKLIKNILNTIHHLLMAAKDVNIYGSASLCRVFTEICKRKSDLMKPLSLCVEMLKVRLCNAPYFIASIAGVWREPFMLSSDQSEEAMILLASISLGAGIKTKKMNDSNWLCSEELISEYFGFPSLPDVNVAINFLKAKIISNCTQNSYEESWMATSSFVILAVHQPWEWTKKHLIEEYIIPNLSRFSYQEPNEKAFALFCDLCVEVHNLSRSMKYSVLRRYTHAPSKGSNFVKEWALVSLIKYMILNKHKIHHEFSIWIKNNQEKLSVQKFRELFLRRNMYYEGLKRIEDIVIT